MVLAWGRNLSTREKTKAKKNIKTTTYKNREIWERQGAFWKHMKEVQDREHFSCFRVMSLLGLTCIYILWFYWTLLPFFAALWIFFRLNWNKWLDLEQMTQHPLIDFPTLTSEVILMKTFRNFRFVSVKSIIIKEGLFSSCNAIRMCSVMKLRWFSVPVVWYECVRNVCLKVLFMFSSVIFCDDLKYHILWYSIF